MDEQQRMAALAWGFLKMAAAFPASFSDTAAADGRERLWREMLEAHPWVTERVFREAVAWTCWHVEHYLPEPAAFLSTCREVRAAQEREAVKALPPPERHPTRPDPAVWYWNVAMARARQRNWRDWEDSYRREHGVPPGVVIPLPPPEAIEPTAAQVQAIMAECGYDVLVSAGAPVTGSAALIGEWPR